MKAIVVILCAALVAQAALAQPPDETTDVDTSTTEADASPLDPAGGKPATVTDPELRLDGARSETDLSYETRVLGAFRTIQGSQGPLDGRWHVAGSDGVALYTLQLTDPGAGEARIEGAWRNLTVSGPGASGFIETVSRENEDVVFTFRDGPREVLTQVRLRLQPNGVWVGETVVGDKKTGVVANRAQGLETASMAVPAWKAPPPPKAKPRPKAKRKAKSRPKSKRKR